VLTQSAVRGVHFTLEDAKIHRDPSHRGGGQVIPATRRVLHAAMMSAAPRLLEPVYIAQIVCPTQALGAAVNVLARRRGVILQQVPQEGTPLVMVQGYLPVNESFGFCADLRMQTRGQAFPQLAFDHWQVLQGDPLDPDSRAGREVAYIRRRKGLPERIPNIENFLERL